eukprot:1327117-Alexandrium_andersonii.AAC.1
MRTAASSAPRTTQRLGGRGGPRRVGASGSEGPKRRRRVHGRPGGGSRERRGAILQDPPELLI